MITITTARAAVILLATLLAGYSMAVLRYIDKIVKGECNERE